MPDGRFAPSPTGPLHLGSLRTALLAWLFARSSGSRFLLRIEDLDPVASRDEHVERQLADLAAIGIDHDGEVDRQSARLPHHLAAIDELTAAGLTYPCYCSRREVLEAAAAPHGDLPESAYPGTCRGLAAADRAEREAGGRRPALRLRAHGARASFVDRLHGEVDGVVDDFVLRRADGVPAYNLAVVVDDANQRIGEVVRGDDLLRSTPRQVHLATTLGLPVPSYAHVPLVLGADGVRLAKRHGAVTLSDRVAAGATPAMVCGLLAASVGLAENGDEVVPADLLHRFDPSRLPTEPWLLVGSGVGPVPG